MATPNKRLTPLTKLKRKGHITDPEVIKIKIQDYYHNLYKETNMET